MFCWQYHDAEKDEEAVYSQLNLNVAIFERTFLPLYDTSIPIYEKIKERQMRQSCSLFNTVFYIQDIYQFSLKIAKFAICDIGSVLVKFCTV